MNCVSITRSSLISCYLRWPWLKHFRRYTDSGGGGLYDTPTTEVIWCIPINFTQKKTTRVCPSFYMNWNWGGGIVLSGLPGSLCCLQKERLSVRDQNETHPGHLLRWVCVTSTASCRLRGRCQSPLISGKDSSSYGKYRPNFLSQRWVWTRCVQLMETSLSRPNFTNYKQNSFYHLIAQNRYAPHFSSVYSAQFKKAWTFQFQYCLNVR